jgi:hypothetical protein
VSPPPNWSPKGRASRDRSIRHVHAPKSAIKIYRHKAWQPIAGIGHPLLLRLTHRLGYIKGSRENEVGCSAPPPSPTPNWTPAKRQRARVVNGPA